MPVTPRVLVALLATSCLLSGRAQAQPAAVDAALELARADRWNEAAAAFALIAQANPYDGFVQFQFGRALSRSGRCTEAVPPLRLALDLGANGSPGLTRTAYVSLASCAAQRGDTAEALSLLDTAWRRHGLRDFTTITAGPRFASVIGTARYRAWAGIPPQPLTDRVERWRFDLAWLDRLIRETHPSPFHAVSESVWAAEVARIGTRIPALSDDQVVAALMGLLSRVGDGHTALYPPMQGRNAWQMLPVWPVMLADGWYLGAAAPAYQSLVGGRIVGAGPLTVEALDSLARTVLPADNTWTARWIAQIPFQLAQFYQWAGAANPDGSVTLRVTQADGPVVEATVRPQPADRDPNARWAPPDWPTMAGDRAAAPRWIRYADALAAIEWMPRERVLYVAMNAMLDTVGRSLPDLGAAIRDSVERRRPAGLILDLRLNNGGDGGLLPPFLVPFVHLPVFQTPGAFQVLIGPRTYSASTFLIRDLMLFTEAETVGWPTGTRPVAYSTETPYRLPMSGLQGSVSTRLELGSAVSTDARPFFAPMTLVWPDGSALRRGADPVLDAALARIATRPR